MYRLTFYFALLALSLDQASKLFVRLVLMDPPATITLTPFFNFILVYNTGVSFSFFANGGELGRWLLSALTVVIVGVLLFWLKAETRRLPYIATGLIVGGAIGNLIDRLYIGAVVDFLDFHIGNWHYATFNIADSAIFCGVFIILIDFFFTGKEQKTEV